jgi:hypothetical protein
MKRILMLGLILALLATMIISTAAFACGAGDGTQAQNGPSYGPSNGGPCVGHVCTCTEKNWNGGECGKP